jgi:hypothetical protein
MTGTATPSTWKWEQTPNGGRETDPGALPYIFRRLLLEPLLGRLG